MNRETAYVSSIPADAKEKITSKRLPDGPTYRAEYFLKGEKVGARHFDKQGNLEMEYAYRNGQLHGWHYRWDTPGQLLSATPYENGVEHGTAYQWDDNGNLIGSYTMEHGTGIDLWWQDWPDRPVELAEVYFMRDGLRHGFEWHFWYCGLLSEEKHWSEGKQHGIERRWNPKGGLRRGWPRYWINGEQVTRKQYLKACLTDPTLPVFKRDDNRRERYFPPEIARHLPARNGDNAISDSGNAP